MQISGKFFGGGSRMLMMLVLATFVLASHATAQKTVDYPAASATGISGINDANTVVGFYYDTDGTEHSFISDGKSFTNIDFPGAAWTEASGINRAGDVVGDYGYVGDPLMHGFLRTADGKFSKFDLQGRFNTMPAGINASGTIVGCMHNMGTMHGWVMQNGALVSLSPAYAMYNAINNAGTIVGWSYKAGRIRSFIVSGTGQLDFDYPNSTNTQAYGINDYGAIVGWYAEANGKHHGFLLHDGQFASIDVAGAAMTHALGINTSGTVVGYYQDANGYHGFVQ